MTRCSMAWSRLRPLWSCMALSWGKTGSPPKPCTSCMVLDGVSAHRGPCALYAPYATLKKPPIQPRPVCPVCLVWATVAIPSPQPPKFRPGRLLRPDRPDRPPPFGRYLSVMTYGNSAPDANRTQTSNSDAKLPKTACLVANGGDFAGGHVVPACSRPVPTSLDPTGPLACAWRAAKPPSQTIYANAFHIRTCVARRRWLFFATGAGQNPAAAQPPTGSGSP